MKNWYLVLLFSDGRQGLERQKFLYGWYAGTRPLGRMRCDLTINSFHSFLMISWHRNSDDVAEPVAYKCLEELWQKCLLPLIPLQREDPRPVAYITPLTLDVTNNEYKLSINTDFRLDMGSELHSDIASGGYWKRKIDPLSMYYKNLTDWACDRELGGEQDEARV